MFTFSNIKDGEVVHQRCVLIRGRCEVQPLGSGEDFVRIETLDTADNVTFPEQRWPLNQGWLKALLMLNPGENKIRFNLGTSKKVCTMIKLHYTPLLQTPPLHLAIMVAKDSPQLIDCSAAKFGSLSGAHSGLQSAIAKFRMTAYMWQAFTAAEMNDNGLQRRSFRLEEEWASDTVSLSRFRDAGATQSTAKIHLVRSDKTVAELRSAQYAQQNPSAQKPDELHSIFTAALLNHGSPFCSELHPVVAGLILDSTFDLKDNLIMAHAALGAHNTEGLSLGMFGSHLTYSWPRFMEEITECLLDTTPPGDLVGNDNGECASMWEACSVGQGAFLHEVGHAFSAPHTSGIMARGYSKDWPKCFLPMTARSVQSGAEGVSPVTPKTNNDCRWDIRDLLRFANLAHFHIPGDVIRDPSPPTFEIKDEDDGNTQVVVSCQAGIGQICFNGWIHPVPTFGNPQTTVSYSIADLKAKYDFGKSLQIEALTLNGKDKAADIVKLLSNRSIIRIPGSGITLRKKSIKADPDQTDGWAWTVLLKKRSRGGRLVSASKVDIRVGCALDGAIVHYKDGTKVPCGPRGKNGEDPTMGGHQARKMAIPWGEEIVSVAVQKGNGQLGGLRMTLSNGKAMGAINSRDRGGIVEILEADEGQKIIGFCGAHGDEYSLCTEFGIVTGPRNKEIPDIVYDMPELQNTPPDHQSRPVKRRRRDESHTEEEDSSTSEDEDNGYDDDY
ncbi:hypothetical protein S40293_07624 [Stachybotrys chartarum IBT 40293]|nr:hypothetical protein S40293_07624 [Stachybotrys chartarum IBT 40293]